MGGNPWYQKPMRLTEGSRLPPLQTLSALDYQVDQVRFV